MNRYLNFKKLGQSVALVVSLTTFAGLISLPAQAAVMVGVPGASIYVGGQPGYYKGYGHGYYGYGGYHGAAYHGGYHHGTVYHNGQVHHYHHYR